MIGRFSGSAIMQKIAPPRLLSIFAAGSLICLMIVLLTGQPTRGHRADWSLSLHHVPDDFCAQPEESWPVHQARIVPARYVDHWRSGLPRHHGPNFRRVEYPACVHGAPCVTLTCSTSQCGDTGLLLPAIKALRLPGPRGLMKRRFCLTLDLKDDPELIAEYKRYHEHVWPEIAESIKSSGILKTWKSTCSERACS